MEELYFDLASLQLNDFPAAKLKVDHLFAEWLIQEGEELVRDLGEMLSNQLQTHFDSTSIHQSRTLSDSKGERTVLPSYGPPRSPTKKSQSPNKKRPHAEFDEHDRLNAQHVITDTSPGTIFFEILTTCCILTMFDYQGRTSVIFLQKKLQIPTTRQKVTLRLLVRPR